jgi:hypothetical protein
MPSDKYPPWASGPGEVLGHALTLLRDDSDANRRLAMLNIDNAVELMVKTYLGLPGKATGIHLKRADLADLETLPRLLECLEKHAPTKLQGLDAVEIEWYHRLRNQLYHNGNGLTVERAKALAYGESARLLFRNLFGADVVLPQGESTDPLWAAVRKFIVLWRELEVELETLSRSPRDEVTPGSIERDGIRPILAQLVRDERIDPPTAAVIRQLNVIRHDIAHGTFSYADDLDQAIRDLQAVVNGLRKQADL